VVLTDDDAPRAAESGELKCLRSKKVTIESIKEKILGKTAPAAQAQQHAYVLCPSEGLMQQAP
jgi:hypothetical protein